jgi:putative FmdB family regulatory protein
MPTYDYVCAACGHAFEQFQEMSAKKLRKCPRCGKSALERQVGTGAGLIFKGSGFYITDYRRGPAPAESVEGGGKKDTAGEGAKPTADAGKGAPVKAAESGKQESPAPAPKPSAGKGKAKEAK